MCYVSCTTCRRRHPYTFKHSTSAYLSDFVFGGDHRHIDIFLGGVRDGVKVTNHKGHQVCAHIYRLGEFITDLQQITFLKLVVKLKNQLKTVDQKFGSVLNCVFLYLNRTYVVQCFAIAVHFGTQSKLHILLNCTCFDFPLTGLTAFLGVLKKAVMFLSCVMVIRNLALRAGSSKQGKARRA